MIFSSFKHNMESRAEQFIDGTFLTLTICTNGSLISGYCPEFPFRLETRLLLIGWGYPGDNLQSCTVSLVTFIELL